MRAVKNFVTLFIGDGINYLCNFFTVIYLARILGVANFGVLNFAFAFYAFSSFLTNLGLISIGTRDIAQTTHNNDLTKQNQYISNVMGLRLFLGLVTFILLVIIALIINKPIDTKLLIIFYGLSLFPFAILIEWAFFGWEKMQFIAIERILVAVSYLVLIFIFVRSSANLLIIPIIFVVSNLIGALFLYTVHRVAHTSKSPGNNKISLFSCFRGRFSEWRQLLVQALPIGLGAILIQFSTNFNTIFLGMIKSDVEVGLFSAANKLLIFILIFDRVFCNTTFPIISRYFTIGTEQLSLLLTRLQKLLFIIAIPICAGGFILSPDIMKLVYGQTYQSSFLIFRILVWFLFITMLNSLYTSSLIAGKKNRNYVWAISIGVIANVILNIILVPIIGGKGTAIALLSAEFVTFIVLIYKTKPILQIKFIALNFLRPIIATSIMIIAIYLLHSKISIIPLIIISAIIYCISIFLMRGIIKQDITTVQQ